MKRLIAFALLFTFSAVPGWCARKITVGQLEDLLRSMQQEKKLDADVATSLKQLELSEELTRSRMNAMNALVPGRLSLEQMYVLEGRSADLIPPTSELPTAPAPDAAAQKAMLAKTAAYVTGVYNKLPSLTATKTTLRFQDNVQALASSSGLQGGAKEVTTSSSFSNPATFVHYINSTESRVASEQGAEKLSPEKDKTRWGANSMIALTEPPPSLGAVFAEAQAAGTLQWLRWELVNGRQAAVFSFTVPKPASHLAVHVCCFPNVSQSGIATFYTASTAMTLGGGGSGGGVAGNFQTSTDWQEYRNTAPYHGEVFVDPPSGIVVRLIAEAELALTELVHQQDVRIDYGPMNVEGKPLMVPVKSFINSQVVPNGDSGAGGYTTRQTLFTTVYKDYDSQR